MASCLEVTLRVGSLIRNASEEFAAYRSECIYIAAAAAADTSAPGELC